MLEIYDILTHPYHWHEKHTYASVKRLMKGFVFSLKILTRSLGLRVTSDALSRVR